MGRPVTLFTGQWADLPCDTMIQKAKSFGYDGVELACWGDHFEVAQGRPGLLRCQARQAESRWHAVPRHLHPPRRPGRVRQHRPRHKQILSPATSMAMAIPKACASVPPRSSSRPRTPRSVSASASSTASPAAASGTSSIPSRRTFPARSTPVTRTSPSASSPSSTSIRSSASLRARSASHRDRLRHRQRRARPPGRRLPSRLRLQLRPQPLRLPGRRLCEVHLQVQRPHFPRPHEGRGLGHR
jgi:hypothetical protein